MILQAVVLAGGLGTRLRSAVGETPKVMAPVAGRPFLEHVLVELDRQGFRRVILAVGYKKEAVTAHFGDSFRGLSLVYSEEQQLLGTGGGVKQALGFVNAGLCFVLNGDTWVKLNYVHMQREHLKQGARLSIAVREVPDVSRFGAVEIESGRVIRFLEKGRAGTGFINAGVYLLSTDVFADLMLPEAFSLERDFLVPNLATLAPLAFPVTGDFIDIGIPEDYQRAQRELPGQICR